MGKVQILNHQQEVVLNALVEEPMIAASYYFTGGTALSLIYLQHRESVDLDFFSNDPVDQPKITELLDRLFVSKGIHLDVQFVNPVFLCNLTFPGGAKLKVDFAQYPYRQLEASDKKIGLVRVDSLLDIATNKLQAAMQRAAVKDYVDLYFLLQTYTFWDLRTGVQEKFHVDLEPSYVASDYLVVEDFTFIPKMFKPLTLDELKRFFRDEAVKIAKTVVE